MTPVTTASSLIVPKSQSKLASHQEIASRLHLGIIDSSMPGTYDFLKESLPTLPHVSYLLLNQSEFLSVQLPGFHGLPGASEARFRPQSVEDAARAAAEGMSCVTLSRSLQFSLILEVGLLTLKPT